MKQSFKFSVPFAVGALALLAATPAFAQTSGSGGDAAFGAAFCGIYGCIGVFALATLVFWIWMIVDVFQRQEFEFPNSTGNSKTTWMIILFVSWLVSAHWIAAIIYYFMVFKKIKRGSMAAPAAPGGYAPPAPPGGYAPAPPAYQPPMAPPAPPAPPVPPAPPAPPAPPVE